MATKSKEKRTESYPKLSALSQEIIATAIQRKLKKGNRITELSLTEALNVSRTPIRKALRELSGFGFLELIPNRGYFLSSNPEMMRFNNIENSMDSLWLYEKIAKDRISGRLPDTVQESHFLRRYKTTRGLLKKVLTQIAEEGWIEKGLGYGWHFLPMIDSLDAYRELYELRVVIEPEGILSPRFNGNSEELNQMLEAQIYLKEKGFRSLPNKELVRTNAEFHELIAASSGNRFLHQTLQRLNKLRLVLELFLSVNRAHVREQASEHIKILELIMKKNNKEASIRMRKHLMGALDKKLKNRVFVGLFKANS